jgi:hypothetical protein
MIRHQDKGNLMELIMKCISDDMEHISLVQNMNSY